MEWELLERPGVTPAKFSLTGDTAIKLLNDAVASAETGNLLWAKKPIVLKPSTGKGRRENLVELVRLSQLDFAKESGETT